MQRRSSILSTAVIAVIVPGLFATVALPAYAYTPPTPSAIADATKALEDVKRANAQTISVDAGAKDPAVARDSFSATSAAEVERAQLAATYAAYTGPTVADFLKNPPYPSFSLDQVVAVALQYQGVPYMYGGATPSGFDCSGYVMFVYAQFGIALPHSAAGIGAMGTPISDADARPGDVVIMPGHTGIYMGNGQFVDSGDYGTVIHVRPIYDSNYYIVRLGI
jgi:cell wall-associated NlpC family hydrolase